MASDQEIHLRDRSRRAGQGAGRTAAAADVPRHPAQTTITTTMEFVIDILVRIFHKQPGEANRIMLEGCHTQRQRPICRRLQLRHSRTKVSQVHAWPASRSSRSSAPMRKPEAGPWDKMEIHEELNRILAVAFAGRRSRKARIPHAGAHPLRFPLFRRRGRDHQPMRRPNIELMKKELETYLTSGSPRRPRTDPAPSLGFQDLMERAVVHTVASGEKAPGDRRFVRGPAGREGIFCRLSAAAEGVSRFTLLSHFPRHRSRRRRRRRSGRSGSRTEEAAPGAPHKKQAPSGKSREFSSCIPAKI